MSAAIASLAASYGSGSGSESDSDSEGGRCQLPAADSLMHLTKSASAKPSLVVAVDSAPEVAVKVSALAFLRCGNWLLLQNLAALVWPQVTSSSVLGGKLLTLLDLFSHMHFPWEKSGVGSSGQPSTAPRSCLRPSEIKWEGVKSEFMD